MKKLVSIKYKKEIKMRNDLYKVERDLRSIAKRYNSVKYSLGLAVLFLMLGGGGHFQRK